MAGYRIITEPQAALPRLAAARDAAAALLYAYAAAQGGRFTAEAAAQALALPQAEVCRAAEVLALHGIAAPGDRPAPHAPTDYAPAELAAARDGDMDFSGLCAYYEAAQGRFLRKSELETLLHTYEQLGIPASVLMLVVNYCKAQRCLSVREVERQAYRWHDDGVTDYEQAVRYLQALEARRSYAARVLRLFGVRDRRPSGEELAMLQVWCERDYPDELLQRAYDLTVRRTGRLSWKYMDRILGSWHEQGLRTVADVELHDRRPASPADKNKPRALRPRTEHAAPPPAELAAAPAFVPPPKRVQANPEMDEQARRAALLRALEEE